MPWGAVIGGVIGAVGSMSAADTQASAQEQAAQTQMQMFSTINNQEKPFMNAGYDATSALNTKLGLPGGNSGATDFGSLTKSFTGADYLANQDPGYQFQLQQGAQALRNQDTPGVGSLSGAALKDLMGFNQSMAATGYNNAFNRFTTQQNNVFTRLSDIANRGQNAASNTGQAGTSLGTGIAQAQAAAKSLAGSSTSLGSLFSGSSSVDPSTGLSWSGSSSLNPGGGSASWGSSLNLPGN